MAQPNNYILKCFIKGDEYSSIMTTTDGFPVIENAEHRIDYATIDSLGIIHSTGVVAKNITDRSIEDVTLLKSIDKRSISKIWNSYTRLLSKKTGGMSYSLTSFPKTGNRNLLVILIDFTDQLFQIANNNFNNLMNQANYNGAGSFRDYWLQCSYNGLTVNSTINGWYHAAHNMAYYGAHSGGNNDTNPRLLVQEAIDAAENAGVNFSTYDNDKDGKVDGVLIIHAGYGEEAGGGANTIWSHHWTLDSYKRTYDGVVIDDYAIVPELRNNAGSNISNIGVICHEFGHTLGLPDLYDTDISNGDSEGIGEWGLMGSGNWNNNGASPSVLCAWSKIFLNWSSPNVLSSSSTISIPNSVQNNIFYRINTPNTNEYFLVENRQHVGFDNGLPGTGLAIWHINTSKTSGTHISANDVNADESLKGVDLEEADGLNQLDAQVNRGNAGDLFPGSSCNHIFNDNSNPNSKTYSPIVNTIKELTNIIESNDLIYFSFMGFNPLTGPNVVCSSGSSFTVIPPSGCTVSWSGSSNLTYSSTIENTKLFTANGNGAGWVQATINSATCGQVTLPQKVVWVGPPNNSLISAMVMQGPPAGNQLCLNSYMTIAAGHSAIAAQGVTSYSWGFGNWSPYFQEYSLAPGPLQARPVFYLPTGAPSSQVLTISAQNLCYPNTTPPFQKTFYAITCGYSMVFSPNPANDNTEVTLTNTDETDIVAYTVKVTNNSGQTLSVDKKSGKRFTLPTSSLKDGLYIVEVVKGNEVYRENLVVKH